MATINLGNASPTEDVKHVDLKKAAVHIQPVTLDTPALTPVATPEETSPAEENVMAGKKLFSLERPDDRARELAAKLTLEEQVRTLKYAKIRAWTDADWKTARKLRKGAFEQDYHYSSGFPSNTAW
jgi:hypothetical protein